METKTKLKSKWSELPLFWQSAYEFVAPYDFDECIRRINALGTKYWDERSLFWNRHSEDFGIDSQQDNGGVFCFKMSGRMKKVTLEAQAVGQLIFDNDQQTRVKVRVGFTMWSIAVFIFLPVFFIAILAVSGATTSTLWAIGMGVFGFVWVMDITLGYTLKIQLHYDIRNALMKEITPLEINSN